MAKAAGSPLSRFLLAKIEQAIEGGPAGLQEEAERLRERILSLEGELRLKDLELQQFKAKQERDGMMAFLEDEPGEREFSLPLLELLKNKGPINSNQILLLLNIDPQDVDASKAIAAQLEALEAYGFIRRSQKGWTWAK
jgi:bacterioferritin (cytochrome b1)